MQMLINESECPAVNYNILSVCMNEISCFGGKHLFIAYKYVKGNFASSL